MLTYFALPIVHIVPLILYAALLGAFYLPRGNDVYVQAPGTWKLLGSSSNTMGCNGYEGTFTVINYLFEQTENNVTRWAHGAAGECASMSITTVCDGQYPWSTYSKLNGLHLWDAAYCKNPCYGFTFAQKWVSMNPTHKGTDPNTGQEVPFYTMINSPKPHNSLDYAPTIAAPIVLACLLALCLPGIYAGQDPNEETPKGGKENIFWPWVWVWPVGAAAFLIPKISFEMFTGTLNLGIMVSFYLWLTNTVALSIVTLAILGGRPNGLISIDYRTLVANLLLAEWLPQLGIMIYYFCTHEYDTLDLCILLWPLIISIVWGGYTFFRSLRREKESLSSGGEQHPPISRPIAPTVRVGRPPADEEKLCLWSFIVATILTMAITTAILAASIAPLAPLNTMGFSQVNLSAAIVTTTYQTLDISACNEVMKTTTVRTSTLIFPDPAQPEVNMTARACASNYAGISIVKQWDCRHALYQKAEVLGDLPVLWCSQCVDDSCLSPPDLSLDTMWLSSRVYGESYVAVDNTPSYPVTFSALMIVVVYILVLIFYGAATAGFLGFVMEPLMDPKRIYIPRPLLFTLWSLHLPLFTVFLGYHAHLGYYNPEINYLANVTIIPYCMGLYIYLILWFYGGVQTVDPEVAWAPDWVLSYLPVIGIYLLEIHKSSQKLWCHHGIMRKALMPINVTLFILLSVFMFGYSNYDPVSIFVFTYTGFLIVSAALLPSYTLVPEYPPVPASAPASKYQAIN